MDEHNVVLNSEEFSPLRDNSDGPFGNPDRIEWLGKRYGFSNPIPDSQLQQPFAASRATPPGPSDFHGAAVMSKVVGVKYGSAKRAKVVFVRSPKHARALDSLRLTLAAVRQHWSTTSKRPNDIGIVTTSTAWGSFPGHISVGPRTKLLLNKLRDEYNSAVEEGLLPFCCAGNRVRLNQSTAVDSFPALFAGRKNWDPSGAPSSDGAVPKLTPVGSTYSRGKLAVTSKDEPSIVKQYAPGVMVWVAGNEGQPPKDLQTSGTSFAAPAVAGVAAYFARLMRRDWDVRGLNRKERLNELYNHMTEPAREGPDGKLIAKARWPRNYHLNDPNYPHAVWNGMTGEDYLQFCPKFPE